MGLTFTVGTTATVFTPPFDAQVHQELEKQLQFSVPKETPFADGGCWSEELGWSGWQNLQERAAASLGEQNIPQLLAMEAWQGVYLPVPVSPVEVIISGHDTPLQCGGLTALVKELEKFAKAEELPTDEEGLQALWEKYMEDDDLIDEDMDIQTYIQLMLTAKIAITHNLPLWVVK